MPDDRTTDKRPASHLVSRPYDIGYNDLEDCHNRRLVLLVLLRLNSYLPPFKRASVQVKALSYSIVKVLRRICLIPSSNKRKESDISK